MAGARVSDDLFHQAHRAAEARLAALDEHAYGEQDPAAEAPPALAAYCGCPTCQVRETLDAAWPYLRRAALEGYPE